MAAKNILYKYVTQDTFDLIVGNESIVFGSFDSFNDPFELRAQQFQEENLCTRNGLVNTFSQFEKLRRLRDDFAAYCLTRSPLNPLMWAHYCESHKGIVIGIDVDEAGFNNPNANLITADNGAVIYTQTKPTFADFLTFGPNGKQPISAVELQRTFLYKASYWSYEEEVRVVRRVDKTMTPLQNVANKYSVHLPLTAIKKVYLGIRHPDALLNDLPSRIEIRSKYEEKLPEATLIYTHLPIGCWQMGCDEF